MSARTEEVSITLRIGGGVRVKTCSTVRLYTPLFCAHVKLSKHQTRQNQYVQWPTM